MTQKESSAVEEVNRKQINKAVEALLKLDSVKSKNDLFAESDSRKINLQFSFARAPAMKNQTIKITLPHSMHHDSAEVCLFVKDLERKKRDYEPTVDHFEGLLKDEDVSCISEVIPLISLKHEYKPFEAKKNLSNRFDVFLADDSIIRLLPSYLGKHFYGRKKAPVQVNLKAKDLKREIHNAVGNTRCTLTGRGTCGMVTCAHSGMSNEEIVDNIVATMTKLSSSVPGGGENLKTFNIKTESSESIPLMVTLKSPSQISLPQETKVKSKDEAEDVTTVEGGKVKVTETGELILFKDDGTKVNLTKLDEEEIEETPKSRPVGMKKGKKRKAAAGKKSGAPPKKQAKTLNQPKSMKKAKKA